MKRFRRGLVVGKFAPLHAGHERLIRAAAGSCEEVLLVSYSLPELPGCEPHKRERWLRMRFPAARVLVIGAADTARLGLPAMPHNEDAADAHRRFVAAICLRVFATTVDAVFTAEDYGDGFAAVLSEVFAAAGRSGPPVAHVRLDRHAGADPVSGTRLRADVHRNRRHLAPEVYADFVHRICLLGGESSGKSTLSVALANALGTTHVAEYGRELWEAQNGALAYADMLHIARTQLAREDAAAADRYLVCDTSPLTTLFYSLRMFGRADPRLVELAGRPYATTVLCAPDFPFVQDGTRRDEAFRAEQFEWYRRELERRAIAYVIVSGSVEARVLRVLEHLGAAAQPPG